MEIFSATRPSRISIITFGSWTSVPINGREPVDAMVLNDDKWSWVFHSRDNFPKPCCESKISTGEVFILRCVIMLLCGTHRPSNTIIPDEDTCLLWTWAKLVEYVHLNYVVFHMPESLLLFGKHNQREYQYFLCSQVNKLSLYTW